MVIERANDRLFVVEIGFKAEIAFVLFSFLSHSFPLPLFYCHPFLFSISYNFFSSLPISRFSLFINIFQIFIYFVYFLFFQFQFILIFFCLRKNVFSIFEKHSKNLFKKMFLRSNLSSKVTTAFLNLWSACTYSKIDYYAMESSSSNRLP